MFDKIIRILILCYFTGPFYTMSRLGRPAMVFENHRYNLYIPYKARNKADHVRKMWRCVKWAARHCRATITTIEDVIVKMNKDHNH